MGRRILLVEDEPGLVMTIQDRLLASSYVPSSAGDGESALRLLAESLTHADRAFDLVILDIMLPDMDGFEVCRVIRARRFQVPILMLTARSAVEDRVRGLKIGADDYLGKPFSMAELMARIEALLRRAGSADPGESGESSASAEVTKPGGDRLNFGDFELDLAGHVLRSVGAGEADKEEISLSLTEFRLLAVLAGNPGRVMSREDLLDAAWGYNNEVTSRTVDVHVAWLRQKLREPDPPRHILTVRRGGYKFLP